MGLQGWKGFVNRRSGRQWGTLLVGLLLLLPMLMGAPVSAARPQAQPELLAMAQQQPTATIDVIVQKTATSGALAETVAALGGTVTRDFSIINAFEATMTAEAAVELARAEGVRWVSLDAAMVDTQAATGTVEIPDWYYLYNNPMPAVGNTASQPVLPLSAQVPEPRTLYNYDTDNDDKPGLVIRRGDKGLSETDPKKFQTWRLEGFATDVTLTADVELRLFAAMKDYKQDKRGVVQAFLVDRAGYETRVIASTSVTQAKNTWQRYWTPLTLKFAGSAGYVLAAGHQLELVITVGRESEEEMWFAYGTAGYNSALTLRGTQYIEENVVPLQTRPTANCSASYCVNTTNLRSTYVTAINADRVWNEPPYRRGDGITVAILDSGVQNYDDTRRHLDGRERVRANRWISDASSKVEDLYGHGSHVAGIIGGNGRLSNGMFIGVAPRVDFVNIKISDKPGRNVTVGDVVAGLQWVFDNKNVYNIRVVNLSLTSSVPESYLTSPLNAAVELLWFKGIVVVTSAGNNAQTASGVVYPPANDPFVITVGATNDNMTGPIQDDTMAPFSAYGVTTDGISKPDIVAPGTNIVSLIGKSDALLMASHRDHFVKVGNEPDPKYFRMSGTSMSAPVVAGAVALLLQDEPNLTPDQVKYRLMATAAKGDRWPAYDPATAGAGYLDIHAAVHGTTTESANTGTQINNLLFTGTEPIQFDSVNWGSVNWGSVNWGSVNWGSVNWGSVNWGSVNWGSLSWEEAQVGWNVNWGNASPKVSSSELHYNRTQVNWGN